jgi:hypothetical protein
MKGRIILEYSGMIGGEDSFTFFQKQDSAQGYVGTSSP